MKRKTKKDIVERVTDNVRDKIDTRERDIYRSDVKRIINAFVEECRNMVIDGDSLVLRGFITICLEDRPPKVFFSKFRGKPSRHIVGPWKAIKITPGKSLKKAVRERYNHIVESEDEIILK
jgi:nucleoid DNA-binding protein